MLLSEQFHNLTLHPQNAARLKELVLQLAVQGKLTENWRKENPGVEPASELLKKIEEEKAQLIKEKKIKKEQPLPVLEDEEISFEIPESWQWVRLGELGDWGAGATPSRGNSEFYDGEINWFKSGELNNDIMDYDSEEKITPKALAKVSLRLNKPGDVLIAMYGATIGKTGILAVEGTTNQAVCACTCFPGFSNLYLHLLLKAYRPVFTAQGAGGAQPNISRVKIRTTPVPLPPLAEQEAIVERVEALFKNIEALQAETENRIVLKQKLGAAVLQELTAAAEEDLARSWQFLKANFQTIFADAANVKKLRETILQLAVQGKLTQTWRHQNPATQTATELLHQIAAEKAKLEKEKKIKKEKVLPPIAANEIPFELPESWAWCRLQDLCSLITDGTHQTPKYTETGRMFLSAQNIKPFKFLPEKHRYVSEEDYLNYIKNRKAEFGDVLVTRVGAGIGEAAMIDQHLDFAIYVSIALLKPIKEILYPEYLVLWLNSPSGTTHSKENTYGKGVSQGNLNLSLIRKFAVSLPSLPEQKAIVEKVEAFMQLCDELEADIRKAEQQAERIMEAVVKEALQPQEEVVI